MTALMSAPTGTAPSQADDRFVVLTDPCPGTIVELKMEGDDAPTSYLVGSIEERHETLDVVSSSSPLGQALLGHGPGEGVSYEGPRRTFQVEIVSVRAGV